MQGKPLFPNLEADWVFIKMLFFSKRHPSFSARLYPGVCHESKPCLRQVKPADFRKERIL
jgi:hypothetical protein